MPVCIPTLVGGGSRVPLPLQKIIQKIEILQNGSQSITLTSMVIATCISSTNPWTYVHLAIWPARNLNVFGPLHVILYNNLLWVCN